MINNNVVKITLLSAMLVMPHNLALAQKDANYINYADGLKASVEKKQENNQYQGYIKDAQNIADQNQVNAKTYKDNFGITHQRAMSAIQSQKYQKHLSGFFPGANLDQFKKELSAEKERGFHQLMIFVSTSMPKDALIQYSQQAKKSGGVLVLRGIINNSFRDTTKFILSLNKEGTRAIIDPHSFRNFNVTNVPQIVVIKDGHGCKDGRCNITPLHDKISGNISLHYALELLSKKGKFSREESKRFLKTLRG